MPEKTKREDLEGENRALREQISDFVRLNEILQTICSSQKVDEILNLIIEEALELCRADQGSIMLFDSENSGASKTLIRKGLSGARILDHYFNNLLAGWVQDNNTTLVTHNLVATFGAQLIKSKHRDISSALSVPFLLKGEIIGVLNLVTLQKTHLLAGREAKLMETLVSQCVHFIVHARLHETLFAETRRLRRELQNNYSVYGAIGNSPKMQEVYNLLERIMPTEGRVIIEGESGTGKELIARILHYKGPRKDASFVAVDCGALPASLLESELFGYVKGAFTGATSDKKGLFEEANGGTLFLDEISNMPNEIQSKFLRAIQENEIRPLGTSQVRKVDVRIITAASCILSERVKKGTFREDLFYRLNVIKITLPPLRERRGDIPVLADHFLHEISSRHNKQVQSLKPETLALLEAHSWPGNVRELENVIERCVILAEPGLKVIPPGLLPPEIVVSAAGPIIESKPDSGMERIKQEKTSIEKRSLLEVLEAHQWNQSSAARELGIHESTLRYKMRQLSIHRPPSQP